MKMAIKEAENNKKVFREIVYQEKRCLDQDENKCEEIMVKDIYYGDEKDEPPNTVEQYLKSRSVELKTINSSIEKKEIIEKRETIKEASVMRQSEEDGKNVLTKGSNNNEIKEVNVIRQDKEEIKEDPGIKQDKVAIRKLGYKLLNKILVILLTSLLIILNVVLPSIDYFIQKFSASARVKATQQQVATNTNPIGIAPSGSSISSGQVDVSLFPFEINVLPVFTNGGKKGNIEIKNPQNSNYWVNVKVYLKDTNEFIYESGLLKPGQEVAEASLNKTLAAGSYEAVAYLDVYELDSKDYVGRTSILISILIQS